MKDTNKTLEAIRDFFNKTGFLYQDESQVQIISGRNEAINAWIAANYIENNFNWVILLFILIDKLTYGHIQKYFITYDSEVLNKKSSI